MKLTNHGCTGQYHTTIPTCHLLRRQAFNTLPRPVPRLNSSASAAGSSPASILDGQWLGSDAFTQFNDRLDAAPLPLPNISRPMRVCLVRHGQSTWNAEGRIQGSSDLSVLSPKGVIQAKAARDMLAGLPFTAMFHSPLARATQTASTICEGRQLPTTQLPALREVDLYGFQGLIKAEGKARYGAQYLQWQKLPAEFEIDGHAPVRELWYRASLAWQQVVSQAASVPHKQQQQRSDNSTSAFQVVKATDQTGDLILVVAHNAVNQALICTALGLGPSSFRAITQANAAVTMLQLTPAATATHRQEDGIVSLDGRVVGVAERAMMAPPTVQLLCLNQTSAEGLKVEDGVAARIILMCCDGAPHADTDLAAVTRLAKLVSSMPVHAVVGPAIHHQAARQLQQLLPSPAPFTPLQLSSAIASPPISESLLNSSSFPGNTTGRTPGHTWSDICGMAANLGGQNLVVLLDAASASHLICEALELSSTPTTSHQATADNHDILSSSHPDAAHTEVVNDLGHQEGSLPLLPFCMSPGTIVVINFSGDPVTTPAVLHAILSPALDFSNL